MYMYVIIHQLDMPEVAIRLGPRLQVHTYMYMYTHVPTALELVRTYPTPFSIQHQVLFCSGGMTIVCIYIYIYIHTTYIYMYMYINVIYYIYIYSTILLTLAGNILEDTKHNVHPVAPCTSVGVLWGPEVSISGVYTLFLGV